MLNIEFLFRVGPTLSNIQLYFTFTFILEPLLSEIKVHLSILDSEISKN